MNLNNDFMELMSSIPKDRNSIIDFVNRYCIDQGIPSNKRAEVLYDLIRYKRFIKNRGPNQILSNDFSKHKKRKHL